MGHMRKLNARELHLKTGAILDQVAAGDVIVIERRGVVVAELRPAGPQESVFPAAHFAAVRRLPRSKVEATRAISEDRDRG